MSTESQTARQITGPVAPGADLGRFWHLSRTLAATDWKVRFYGSALGYAWSLLRPLLLFGIIFFVFSVVVDAGGGVENYGVLLLVGMTLYFYFGEVTGSGVTALVDRESLVRKVGFPRMVVPVSVALVASMGLGLNLLVVAGFVLATGVDAQWTWLLLPIPLALLAIFATGGAMLLSALYVPFRDVRPIWDVVLQALFYATPILYPVERLAAESETLAHVAMCNPLAAVIQETRHLLLGPGTPSAAEAIGSAWLLLVPAGILVGTMALGFAVFHRMAPKVAENL